MENYQKVKNFFEKKKNYLIIFQKNVTIWNCFKKGVKDFVDD